MWHWPSHTHPNCFVLHLVMLMAMRWIYFLVFVLSAVSRNIKDHRVILKSPDKHLDIWRPFWQETVRPLIILAAGWVNKFQACFPSCHVELYCPSVPLRVNIPHRRSNLSCSFNFGRETVNCQCCREFDWIAIQRRMPVTQLLLLVLVTTVRASPEHRVTFSEDYNSQLLPPTEVNKWK